ncbi:MAG: molecular chaperone, small heat shock protein [halophilic archaeon J07HX5]|nr:MAG: molecular chaperone, small heat shock protein [halophilic archaeon J07HX5]
MALPQTTPNSWVQGLDFPSQLFETGGTDYELYEQDDEFVLSVELPGFDPSEITVAWDDGVLNIAADSEDPTRNQRRTHHQRFRFPKNVDDDGISAEYRNGILELRLPVETEAVATGREIPIET